MTDAFALALAHHQAGRLDHAEAGYRAILSRAPENLPANNNLAVLLRAQRRWEEAVACYDRALGADPHDAQLYNNLTCVLSDLGRDPEAMAAARTAVILRPEYAEAWFNLGNILHKKGDRDGAKAAYIRAISLRPDMGEAFSNLGDVYKAGADLTRAEECYRAALRYQPKLPQPYVNLGETLKEQGRVIEAITLLQQGLEVHPTLALLHSNLLLALHYTPVVPPEVIFRAHRHWGERHAAPLAPATPRPLPERGAADRRLRVGYVSPDFCTHAVACFLEPLLQAHDRTAVEIVCYATSRRHDATTARFQALADHWRPIAPLSDDEAAAQVMADGIDILVDLAGHTADSRPLLFARKPAPVQVSWLGYPDTSGMAVMDYRLTDAIADPPGASDRRHTETLVRLEPCFLAFLPLDDVPVAPDPPVSGTGVVTFGSFNNNAKVTPEVVRLWAAVLRAVPSARLILKSRPFADADTRARYLGLFSGHGVDAGRIDLLPFLDDLGSHLRAYDRVDIALDPFPYSGTTTSCEALWMGVPVVTLAGDNHVSRVTASLLATCGLHDLIATDEEGYVARAVALAADQDRLATLRRTMRDRLLACPLTDYTGFARRVEAAYRAMMAG
ncbi:tetratricopeptide repeat protein [Novispirillum sp. DQ9]|uniref:O-linked N-acetylglucosamine transferase, SPINDLY family protein n=1 Tax=Novispirillum sp. DQ9 TaxID=3398612 RepID=UPI003C7D6E9B